MAIPALSLKQRTRSLTEMTNDEGVDVLVIGGGVTGAGIALDAATRGLKVAIVEAQDWAAGTSSRSSKLVHGGLRYLYQLDLKLVHESLRERGLLLTKNAPHLVKAQPLLWPFHKPLLERTYSTVGVGLYDAMAQAAYPGSVPLQRHHTRKGSLKLAPALKEDSLTGSMIYYDCRVDDARLVVTLVRTAIRYGALAASRCQVVSMTRDSRGRIIGADLVDFENGGQKLHVKAKAIVVATGVWTEQTEALGTKSGGLKVLASKGIHLVVPKEKINSEVGLFVRTEKSVLFIIPWKRYWLIGTTDTEYREHLREPVANAADIDYVLEQANRVLANPLTHSDVISTYAGLRPLLQPGVTKNFGSSDCSEATDCDNDINNATDKVSKVSREHTVSEVAPGLTVIAGGKLTSYRQMAEDAVDFVLGERAPELPSVTSKTPLEGGANYFALWSRREVIARENNLSVEQVEDLLDRYGGNIFEVLEIAQGDHQLGEPLLAAPEYLAAEVVFACRFEGAMHLEDVLRRRIRLVYEHKDSGIAAVPQVVELMAKELGWGPERQEKESRHYIETCQATMRVREIHDEAEAQSIMEAIEPIAPMQDFTN